MSNTDNRKWATFDDDVATHIEQLTETGEYDSESKAIQNLVETGLKHREYEQDYVSDHLLHATLVSGVATILTFAVGLLRNWPVGIPLAGAALTLLLGIVYAVRVHTILNVLNGGV